jgi:hypothetical protein
MPSNLSYCLHILVSLITTPLSGCLSNQSHGTESFLWSCYLWSTRVHYRVQKRPSLGPITIQIQTTSSHAMSLTHVWSTFLILKKTEAWDHFALCTPLSTCSVYISWDLSPSTRRTSYSPSVSPFCMCIPPIFARQRLGINVTAPTNTHATTELLDVLSFIQSVSYQRKKRSSGPPRSFCNMILQSEHHGHPSALFI